MSDHADPATPQVATILVVDDEARNLKLLDALLQGGGYRAALAANDRNTRGRRGRGQSHD
jgi:CheY-like chemotaxis protein